MAKNRSQTVTKKLPLRHFKKSPSIYEFRLFVALCDAASLPSKKNSKRIVENEEAESEEANADFRETDRVKKKPLAQIQRELTALGWNARPQTISRCLRAMEGYWRSEKNSLLSVKKGEGTEVTDEGLEARAVAMRIIDAVDQANLIRWNRRQVVRFATHNAYELVLVPELMQAFTESMGGNEGVELQTYEISDIWQGIDLLRTGTVSLVLDGVTEKPRDEFIDAQYMGVSWKRVVLIPKCPDIAIKKKVAAIPNGKLLTMEQLADVPLCFVERGEVFESELTQGARAPRLGLGSIEAVRRLVSTGFYLGLSINWTRVLGEDFDEEFDIRFLRTSRPDLKLYLCRSVNWNESKPAATFYKMVQTFFTNELQANDQGGRPHILPAPEGE